MKFNKFSGFTLLELMIVVALIAIAAAIAIPAYSDYATRARRADAKNALMFFQIEQEKHRANNLTYADAAALGLPANSPDGYYTITVTSNTATDFRLTATPNANQTDPDCGIFVYNSASVPPESVSGPLGRDACWNR